MRNVTRFVSCAPFTLYGILALVGTILMRALELSYDSGGIGGIVALTWPVWALPYWITSEIMFVLNDGHALSSHAIWVAIAGIALCATTDGVLALWCRRPGAVTANRITGQ